MDQESRTDVWEALAGIPIVQTFPLDILKHHYTYHIEYSLHDQAKNIPANPCIPCWRSQLDMFHVRSLLAVGCGARGVKGKASIFSVISFDVACFQVGRSVLGKQWDITMGH